MLVFGLGLGEEVGKIVGSLQPFDDVVALANTVAYPMESHVDGFCAAEFDGVVSDANGTSIVAVDKRGWLGVTKRSSDGA